ncbi:MAG: hypothetical protein ACREQM_15055 [Candidatus Dormibacteraceae bacterium]
MLIADLSHYQDADPEQRGAYRLGRRLGEITYAATSIPAGRSLHSALPCHRRPRRRPCPGYLRIARPALEVPQRIEWQCSECRDGGAISGWQGGRYDLRPEPDFDRELLAVEVSDDEHRALREVKSLDVDGMHVVWGAFREEDGQLWMVGDVDDLEDLSGAVAFEANHEGRRRRRDVLDDVFGKLELHLAVAREGQPG